jgi:poly(3-hydroxyalkanoate) depolymerase
MRPEITSLDKSSDHSRAHGALAHGVSKLAGAMLDPESGMMIGMLTIEGQPLRVGLKVAKTPNVEFSAPLLLFNGIGANLELAAPFLHALPERDAIIFDVPGAGRSPTPSGPYRLKWLTRLAALLLDELGVRTRCDIMGVSWGGGLAQQFAISQPARVRRLILAATAMGMPMLPGRPSVLYKMVNPRRYIDKTYMARIAPEIYGGDLRRDPDAIDLFVSHARGGSKRGYRYQLLAMAGWTSFPWLWRIRQRTLVLAGTDDPLIPLINARVHAALLPRARLVEIDDGHLFLLTRAESTAGIVREFLDAA